MYGLVHEVLNLERAWLATRFGILRQLNQPNGQRRHVLLVEAATSVLPFCLFFVIVHKPLFETNLHLEICI